MFEKLVSIIIPAYNVDKYIGKTIDSCINQTYKNIEIIIINDGSTDNTSKIINNYANIDSRIIIINKPNGGVTSARSCGYKKALGKYIFYLDGDDFLENTSIELLYNKAEQTQSDFTIGDFRIVYNNGNCIKRNFCINKSLNNVEFIKYMFEKGDFYYTGRLIKKSLLDKIQLEIPREITFGEDNVAMIQIAYNLNSVEKINSIVLNYVQRCDSVTNKLNNYDLDKRSIAIKFIIDYIKEKPIYEAVNKSVRLFVFKEIYANIRRKYRNKQYEIYLKDLMIYSPYILKRLRFREIMLLLLAKWNFIKC